VAVRRLIVLVAIAVLSGCVMPQTTVRTGSAQPGLIVKGAPAGSTLFVDGLPMGPAAEFNGNPKVLAVLEGAHTVEVHLDATVVYREKAFVSSGETHTVTVVGGSPP
jgi:hypothetical protein